MQKVQTQMGAVWSESTQFAIPSRILWKKLLHKMQTLGKKKYGIKRLKFLDIYHN